MMKIRGGPIGRAAAALADVVAAARRRSAPAGTRSVCAFLALGGVSIFGTSAAASPRGLPPAPRWILIYAGGPQHPKYTTEEFRQLITVIDTSGQSTGWLMTGAIFLEIRASSGRGFATWGVHPPATGRDWESYVDTLLGPGGAVARLDSAVGTAETRLGSLAHKFSVTIMLPYPDPAIDSLRYEGQLYRPSVPGERLALTRAYIHEVQTRFAAGHFQHVALYGIYWLYETVVGPDRPFIPLVASAVHDAGLRFLWIPYYHAAGYDSWRSLGFDEAWYQPNYFFHPGVSTLRVDSAMTAADTLGMGVELELDGRLVTNPEYANQLLPYLVTLWLHPSLRARSIAVYDGAGWLFKLATTTDPRMRDQYDRLVSVLTSPAATATGR